MTKHYHQSRLRVVMCTCHCVLKHVLMFAKTNVTLHILMFVLSVRRTRLGKTWVKIVCHVKHFISILISSMDIHEPGTRSVPCNYALCMEVLVPLRNTTRAAPITVLLLAPWIMFSDCVYGGTWHYVHFGYIICCHCYIQLLVSWCSVGYPYTLFVQRWSHLETI
jgi:hypothetical protein